MPTAFIHGKTGTATLGGTALTATDVDATVEFAEDEVTNLAGGGFYNAIPGIKKASGTLNLVIDGNAVPTIPTDGSTVTFSLAVPTFKTLSGTARLFSLGSKVGVKGAFTISVKFSMVESFTYA